MISRHIPINPKNDRYGRLADYIAATGAYSGRKEKPFLTWCMGCAGGENYAEGIEEVEDTQALNTRAWSNKTYHLVISFRPEDAPKLTPEVLKDIERRFAAAIGLAEHQRHCAFHTDTQNPHIQVAYNLIHPERFTRHEPFQSYKKRNALCRELEQEYGFCVDNGMDKAGRSKRNESAVAVEVQRGEQSFYSYVRERKESILQALDAARSWQDLHKALVRHGLEITPRGNGLIVKNRHGKQAVKASDIDRRLSKNKLEAALGAFVRATPTLTPEESRYKAKPLQRSPACNALYRQYEAESAAVKAEVAGIKERQDISLAAIREKWRDKQAEIEKMSIHKKNRRNLLQFARKSEAAEIAAVKAQAQRERRDRPYESWNDFLCRQAGQGSEIALAVLRSRQKPVDPEIEPETGPDYSALAAMKADYAKKQVEVLKSGDLERKGKKHLLAYLRMEQLTQEERLKNPQATDLKTIRREVDKKGAVVFSFVGGGKIRDTGSEVLFSNDTERLALLYAKKKWGPFIMADKGRIIFDRDRLEREKQRGISMPPPAREKDQGISR